MIAGRRLIEVELVSERVGDCDHSGVVEGLFDPGPHVCVGPGGDLAVKLYQSSHPEKDRGARAAVPVMLRQVEYATGSRHLLMDGSGLIETVLPVDLEAEKVD